MEKNSAGRGSDKPFFARLSEKETDLIKSYSREKKYLPGDIIVREKTLTDTFCIIKKGTVEVTKKYMESEEMVLAVMGDGDFFGEMALLDQGTRSATVKALTGTTILELSRKNFELLLRQQPELAYSILRELAKRLREAGSLLISHLERKNSQLTQAYIDTVQVLVNALEARDSYTYGHTARVTVIAKAIAKKLGMAAEDLYTLEIGALLHDVGKIGVPDSVLGKPGPLEKSEYAIITEHPGKGGRILKDIEYLENSIPSVMFHHERFDGKGYPEGLSGKNIPLAGRIIAIADSFDAMISDRPYKEKISVKEAVKELRRCSGSQFDSEIAETFIKIIENGEIDFLKQPPEETEKFRKKQE